MRNFALECCYLSSTFTPWCSIPDAYIYVTSNRPRLMAASAQCIQAFPSLLLAYSTRENVIKCTIEMTFTLVDEPFGMAEENIEVKLDLGFVFHGFFFRHLMEHCFMSMNLDHIRSWPRATQLKATETHKQQPWGFKGHDWQLFETNRTFSPRDAPYSIPPHSEGHCTHTEYITQDKVFAHGGWAQISKASQRGVLSDLFTMESWENPPFFCLLQTTLSMEKICSLLVGEPNYWCT